MRAVSRYQTRDPSVRIPRIIKTLFRAFMVDLECELGSDFISGIGVSASTRAANYRAMLARSINMAWPRNSTDRLARALQCFGRQVDRCE